ncbi:MAG: nitroreductase family protein [Planctomycetota bacterium]
MTADAKNPVRRDILPSLQKRFSPYRFASGSVSEEALTTCFEASAWAASSFNEQPWRFIVARRDDAPEFERMLGCLLEANRSWARHAGALVLTAYRSKFSRNEKPNRVALHDLGQASAYFAIQATALGLQVHQMAGINVSQIRTEYAIPDEFEPATAIAIGNAEDSDPVGSEAEEWARRESSARQRKQLSEVVFSQKWENAAWTS